MALDDLVAVRFRKAGSRDDDAAGLFDLKRERLGIQRRIQLLAVLFDFGHGQRRAGAFERFLLAPHGEYFSLHERQTPPHLGRMDESRLFDFLVLLLAGIGETVQQQDAFKEILFRECRARSGFVVKVHARPTLVPAGNCPGVLVARRRCDAEIDEPALGRPSRHGHVAGLLDPPHRNAERLADESGEPCARPLSATSAEHLRVRARRAGPVGSAVPHIRLDDVIIPPLLVVDGGDVRCVVHEHVASPLQLRMGRVGIDRHAVLPRFEVREAGIELALAVRLLVVLEALHGVDLDGGVELRLRDREFQGARHGQPLVDLLEAVLRHGGHDLRVELHRVAVLVPLGAAAQQHLLHDLFVVEQRLDELAVQVGLAGEAGQALGGVARDDGRAQQAHLQVVVGERDVGQDGLGRAQAHELGVLHGLVPHGQHLLGLLLGVRIHVLLLPGLLHEVVVVRLGRVLGILRVLELLAGLHEGLVQLEVDAGALQALLALLLQQLLEERLVEVGHVVVVVVVLCRGERSGVGWC
mmetsp:Transcript_21769/g.61965  ORF Transcript_21769/g.61965 Transcript_21769/m.61965 type:complete len:526 (-) Transcript_21769:202-1779(-)